MPRNDRPADEHDASRREFFRTFSRQTVRNAGAVVGAATELRRSSLDAARQMLGAEATAIPTAVTAVSGDEEQPPAGVARATPEWSYRSAYRFLGDSIVLLDQRELPGRVATIAVSDPSEAASAIRAGVVNGGPVTGQIAAYAMVLAARAAAGRSEAGRQQQIRAALGTLRAVRPELRVIGAALDALEGRYDAELEARTAPADVARALEGEADRIARESNLAHAAIGRLAAGYVTSTKGDEVVQLLFHGDQGPLSCGMVGSGTSLMRALTDSGRSVHAWVTEAAPAREGARVAVLQLAQHDVPHTLIPDSAVAWLFANRPIHAAVLRGDRLAVNGDTGTIVGGLAVAQLAVPAAVPVLVLAPSAAQDPSAATGVAMSIRLSASGNHLNPTTDVIPAALITRIVTEQSVVVPSPRGRGAAS